MQRLIQSSFSDHVEFSRPVPFHSFAHAVDVLHAVSQAQTVNGARVDFEAWRPIYTHNVPHGMLERFD